MRQREEQYVTRRRSVLSEVDVEEGALVCHAIDDKKLRPPFAVISRPSYELVCPSMLAAGVLLFIITLSTCTLANLSSSVTANIMVQAGGENLYDSVTRLEITNDPHHWITDRENKYWIDHGTSWHPNHHLDSDSSSDDEDCVPLGDWQEERNILSCNMIHEVNLLNDSLKHIGNGSDRDAWVFDEYDGTHQVLKTLRWRDHLDWDEFEEARKEAVAMAQLRSSPYVVDIYSYCSHSAIMPHGEEVLWWLFKDGEPSREERFRIARDVAMGVADAQNVDSEGRATIVHTDIKPNQFILINGTYQLNDFNMCEFLRWDTEDDEYCSFAGGYAGRWQSPEQIARHVEMDNEKSDVFSLGHVLYFILTGDHPWGSESSSSEAATYVVNGEHPEVDDSIEESDHPFDVAMLRAMWPCLEHDPDDRPTAREVADFLQEQLVEAGLEES